VWNEVCGQEDKKERANNHEQENEKKSKEE